MEDQKKYDLVIFGATGFTGGFVVDETARVAVEENLTWAIAGRNMAKLQKVLSGSSERVGRNIEETAIITADTSSYQSLLEMAQQCKVVVNCVGPYQIYGEDVVKACIEGSASHLDLSGEPQFLEKMQLLYNGKAKEKGIFIIGSTGFDSIPTEMGISYTRKQFKGEVTNIDSFYTLRHGPKGIAFNTGTMESILHIIANWSEIKSLRESLFPEPMPKYEHCLPKRLPMFFSEEVNKWCLSFPGNETSTYRTMRDLLATKRLEKPFEFREYACQPNILQAIGFCVFAMIMGVMSFFSVGRSLVMKFPHLFTFGMFKKGGPSKEQIEGTSFAMTFVAHGYKEDVKDRTDKKPDKVITTKIVGPEVAYITTSTCMVLCAVTLLKEKDRLISKGGVFPPGAIFEETTLIDRLEKRNIKFSTVE